MTKATKTYAIPNHNSEESVYARSHPDEKPLEGKHIIHIQGAPLSGAHTLCGQIDREDFQWHAARPTAKVTCSACLDTWNFVKNSEI